MTRAVVAMADSAPIEFLPGTTVPAPALMTECEAAGYLRLDENRSDENAVKALNRLVAKRLVRPCLVGNRRRYWRHELIRFMRDETERYSDHC